MEALKQDQQTGDYPLYNIGVVSRTTGISIASLRAWERRYGFPESGRTTGGHRLYSERDVLRLRWVKAQTDQGLQTAQAIQALRRREVDGAPLEDTLVAGGGARAAMPPMELVGYRERLVAALTAHDSASADHLLGQAMLAYPLGDLIFDVIVPALSEIGQAWQDRQINIATEHFATHYLRSRLMTWMLGGPPSFPLHPVVLAGAPGELHEGSLLILGALLRRRRWPVAYLGASVPLPDLAAFVAEIRPPAVVLVAMREEAAAALVDWPRHMPGIAQTGYPLVGYGGFVFSRYPEWRERVPGTFLGETIKEGVDRLDDFLQASYPQWESPS